VDYATGNPLPPESFRGQPAGAFCGLGNPGSFWCTLEELGIRAVERLEFSDHHEYRPRQLRRMAAQLRQPA